MAAINPETLKPLVITSLDDDKLASAVMDCFNKRFEGFENLDALKEYLKRNTDPEIQSNGAARTMWIALENEQGNIVAFTNRQMALHTLSDGSSTVTTSDDYIYVDGRGPTSTQDKAIADKLYAAADKATQNFIESQLGAGASVPVYNFAAETSPLLVSKTNAREPQVKYSRDLDRLADAGFQRVGARYLEASYDDVNGAPTEDYDLHAKLPPGQTTLPTEVLTKHLTRNFDISYPEGTSLDNDALRAMAQSIARQGESGQIPVLPMADHHALMAEIQKLMPEKLTPEQRGRPTGELTPELRLQAAQYYGNLLPDYKDTLPKASAQAAVTAMIDMRRENPVSQDDKDDLTRRIGEHLDTIRAFRTAGGDLSELKNKSGHSIIQTDEAGQITDRSKLNAIIAEAGTGKEAPDTRPLIAAQAFTHHAHSSQMQLLSDASGTDACKSAINRIFDDARSRNIDIRTPEQFAEQATNFLQDPHHLITAQFLEDAKGRKATQETAPTPGAIPAGHGHAREVS